MSFAVTLKTLNREALYGLSIIVLVILLGIIVPIASPNDASGFVADPLAPPSINLPFGADHMGRDLFVRTFAAARLDIVLAVLGASVPIVVGTFIGVLTGAAKRKIAGALWDALINAITAFPEIVLVLAIITMIGGGWNGLLYAIWLSRWAQYARLARAKTLKLHESEFVQAAKVLGYSRIRIMTRHIMPNVYSEAIAYALSDFVFIIVVIGGLSFLGMGVRPPTPEWGGMLAEGRIYLQTTPRLVLFPGAILSLTAIGVALFAQGLARHRKEVVR